MAEKILSNQADRSLFGEGKPSRGAATPGRLQGGQGTRRKANV